MRLNNTRRLTTVALAAVLAGTGLGVTPALAKDFSDVPADSWYAASVKWVSDHGLMNGYGGSDEFGAEKSLTCYELANILWRNSEPEDAANYAAMTDAEKKAVKNTTPLADVADGEWFTPAANWAYRNNVITGYSGTTFGGNDPLTVQRFVVIMARYADPEGLAAADESLLDGMYTDAGSIDSWAKKAAVWARQKGVLSGYPNADGTYTFGATEEIQRGRVAAVIANAGEKEIIHVEPVTPEDPATDDTTDSDDKKQDDTPVTPATPVTPVTPVTPTPAVDTYTVTFVVDGREVKTEKLEMGATIAVPDKPTKEGYTFRGWYDASGNAMPSTCTGDATYAAAWSSDDPANIRYCTITLVFQGGTATVYNHDISEAFLLPEPGEAAEGTVFNGWATEKDGGGTLYQAGTSLADFTAGQEITLYAAYNRSEYTITFDANGGMFDAGTQKAAAQTTAPYHGEQLGQLVDNPTQDKKAFLGWATTSNASTPDLPWDTVVDHSMTVYAVWTDGIPVTFDANGGKLWSCVTSNFSEDTLTINYYSGENLFSDRMPYEPLLDNKAFLGWATTKEATTPDVSAYEEVPVTGERTLYAVWGDVVYVTFDANGGTFEGDTTVVSRCTKGSALNDGAYWAANGDKVCVGWATRPDATEPLDTGYVLDKDQTLYAVWKDPVAITFDANGGYFIDYSSDTQVSTRTITYGTGEQLDRRWSFPSRDNMYFIGWATTPGGTDTVSWTSPATEPTTYYAVWSDKAPY